MVLRVFGLKIRIRNLVTLRRIHNTTGEPRLERFPSARRVGRAIRPYAGRTRNPEL